MAVAWKYSQFYFHKEYAINISQSELRRTFLNKYFARVR